MIQLAFDVTLGPFRLAPKLNASSGITVVFGPSGAGKTLTLEAVAGLLQPDHGHITIDRCPLFDEAAGINVPAHDRNLGYLVQNYGLFPHMTVAQNVAYGLWNLSRNQRDARVSELLKMLNVQELAARRPAEISGGQAQRVALARAIARGPQVLLLDEPFAALDLGNATALRRELRRLVRELKLTALLVTHDLSEAYAIGDRIAVMDGGEVLQVGELDHVASRPRNAHVARLLGIANILNGEVVTDDGEIWVQTPIGILYPAQQSHVDGTTVEVAIRSDRIRLEDSDQLPDGRPNTLPIEIIDESDSGTFRMLYVRVPGRDGTRGDMLEMQIAKQFYEAMDVASGRQWRIYIPPEAVYVMGLL